MEKCKCTQAEVHRYLGKISRPLLDRIDLCADIPETSYEDLKNKAAQETSEDIRKRVVAARELQRQRYEGLGILCNSELHGKQMDEFCTMSPEASKLIKSAFDRMQLSMRSYHRVLRVSRTIADLDHSDRIEAEHLAEALSYRGLDRKYWA